MSRPRLSLVTMWFLWFLFFAITGCLFGGCGKSPTAPSTAAAEPTGQPPRTLFDWIGASGTCVTTEQRIPIPIRIAIRTIDAGDTGIHEFRTVVGHEDLHGCRRIFQNEIYNDAPGGLKYVSGPRTFTPRQVINGFDAPTVFEWIMPTDQRGAWWLAVSGSIGAMGSRPIFGGTVTYLE